LKVLIADDDQISRKILEKSLGDWGYEIVSALNGEEAWKIIRENEIHLAILDWMMPGIDGIELCRKIRREIKEKGLKYIYIILITGKNQQRDIIKGLSAGADDYMAKPFNLAEFKVRLQNGQRIIDLEDSRLKLATTDSLTQLWNRRKIFEFAKEELDRGSRQGTPVSVIMIDIDHFKIINDTYGHFAGDKVLCEVADRLKKGLRSYDKIGRFGGDEMIAVLPNCSRVQLKHIAGRLVQSINREKILSESGLLDVTISLGGASSDIFPKESAESLLQISDKALYSAKKRGRNQIVIAEAQTPNNSKPKSK